MSEAITWSQFDPKTVAVAALGLIAVVCSLVEYARFQRESRWLKKVIDAFGSGSIGVDALYAQIRAQMVAVPKESFVLRRLLDVRTLVDGAGEISVPELSRLDDERASTALSHRFPKFLLAGLLVMGVGCTFWGLTTTLAGIDLTGAHASPAAGSQPAAATPVDKITIGFERSFHASLAAIAGTIVLLFVQMVFAAPKRATFFNKLDHFTSVDLLPAFTAREVATDAELLHGMAAKMESMVVHFEQLFGCFSETLRQADNTRQGLATFTDQLAGVINTFSEAIGGNSQFHATIKNLHDVVCASDKRHEEFMKKLGDVIAAGDRQNRLLSINQGLSADFQKALMNSQAVVGDSANKLIQQTRDTIKAQEEAAKANAAAAERVAASAERLTAAAESRLGDARDLILKIAQGFAEKQAEIVRENAAVLTNQQTDAASALESLAETAKQTGTLLGDLKRLVEQNEAAATARNAAAEHHIVDITQALGTMGGALASINGQVGAISDTLAAHQAGLEEARRLTAHNASHDASPDWTTVDNTDGLDLGAEPDATTDAGAKAGLTPLPSEEDPEPQPRKESILRWNESRIEPAFIEPAAQQPTPED